MNAAIIAITLISTVILNAQPIADLPEIEQELLQLNRKIKQEGELNNHPVVESIMDKLVERMETASYPSQEIQKRMHLRIHYSLNAKRYESARKTAAAWLEKHPQDWGMWDLLGITLVQMNRTADAREVLQKIYLNDPKNAIKQRRYLFVLNKLGMNEEAVELCEEIVNTNGDDALALTDVINTYLSSGTTDRALPIIDRLERMNPEEGFIAFARGKCSFEKSEYERAVHELARVQPASPHWMEATMMMGQAWSRLQQYEKAALRFVDILTRDPYSRSGFTLLEQALARMRKQEGSQLADTIHQQAKKAHNAEDEAAFLWRTGDWVDYARVLSESLQHKSEFHAAEQVLKQACQAVPDSTQALLNLARYYQTSLQANHAVGLYDPILNNPQIDRKEAILLERVEAQLRQGLADEPLALLRESNTDESMQRSLNALIGTYYLELKGEPANALPFLTAIEDASSAVTASIAKAFVESGSPETALRYFLQLPLDYDDPSFLMAKVRCLAELEMAGEANALFQQAVEKHASISPLLTIPAQAALAKVNHATDAAEWEKRAQDSRHVLHEIQTKVIQAHRAGLPKSAGVLSEISRLHESTGDDESALLYARRAYQGNQGSAENLIRVIELMRQPERSFERLHLIERLQNAGNIAVDFSAERREAYSRLGLRLD